MSSCHKHAAYTEIPVRSFVKTLEFKTAFNKHSLAAPIHPYYGTNSLVAEPED
jgi:hypothetical protein